MASTVRSSRLYTSASTRRGRSIRTTVRSCWSSILSRQPKPIFTYSLTLSRLPWLRHTTQDNLPSFLTLMFVPRIPKALQVEWEVHLKDSEGVPPIDDLLTFLGFRADVLSSAATSGKASEASSRPADRKQSQAGRKQTAAVHASTPRPSPSSMPYGYRYECNLCPG